MRLTTKGRYAVTAMLDLALNADNGPISLAGISKRQEISLSYLEQLFSKLRQNELVSSVRGPGGGYRLSRAADEIFVAEIVDAVNESIDATSCGGEGSCHKGDICLTHHLWCDLSKQIHEFLSGISLASLVARKDIQAVSERLNSEQTEAPLAGQQQERISASSLA
ncbi:MAG: Fe-S cluster assembly transcriptional regulator IscR [Cellvibrionaceae bacterium]|nr:Fe-S cluster assembly transcriptional regulator IscR [Cellvibrionaceae bacterium]MCV6626943.1 Fe-S cluster assembly transcriptional regulator IscR [Cellvibrionaceae bacterium]